MVGVGLRQAGPHVALPIVVDASITLSWLLPDEQRSEAQAAIRQVRGDVGLAPAGWPIEVTNGLLLAERRQRITPEQTDALLARLRAVAIRVAEAPDRTSVDAILSLAREHRLTAYDASYLELALRERAAIASLDDRLKAAARRAGVGIVGG